MTVGLSVIVRLHDPARLTSFEEAVFSVAVQRFRDVQIIAVIQGDAVDPVAVCRCIGNQPFDDPECVVGTSSHGSGHRVIRVEDPGGTDLRSHMLNLGLEASRSRFVAILDDDDVVYQHGYSSLVSILLNGNAALAAGGCVRADVIEADGRLYVEKKLPWMHAGRSQRDLIRGNFLPIHSYVLDRTRIASVDLRFDEGLSRLEDYELLLRLGAKYEFDLSLLGVPVCEYRRRTDRIRERADERLASRQDAPWAEAEARIAELRRELQPRYLRMQGISVRARARNTLAGLATMKGEGRGWIDFLRRGITALRRKGLRHAYREVRRIAAGRQKG